MSNVQSNSVISCPVTDKVGSILVCARIPGTKTEKYDRSGEKYLATDAINAELEHALRSGSSYKATGKVDGTCCRVEGGRLQKRRDVKDDRKVPPTWVQTGEDKKSGHLIGFMDLEKGDKWHYDCHVKDESAPNGLDLTKIWCISTKNDGTGLEYKIVDTASLNGCTVEVMGPKFQSNPHSLDRHCVMIHGEIELKTFPDLRAYITSADSDEPPKSGALATILEWFNNSLQGPHLEGVVLHMSNGSLYKLHRHHLDAVWNAKSARPLLEIVL